MVVPRPLYRPLGLIMALAVVLLAAMIANGRISSGMGTAAAAVGPCGTGTAFFGSAPVGTQFAQGDSWQGGTFTTLVTNNPDANDVMNVQIFVDEHVGRFPSVAGGSTAVITFPQPIVITGILWAGNGPEAGEAGWSVNGVAGPITGDGAAACTSPNMVTDTVTIYTEDSGGIDFWFEPVGAEGCTPGYWKNHLDSWAGTGFAPTDTLESVFDVPDSLGMDSTTLLQALNFNGGSGVSGGARILLRAAVASLLNSAHAGVDFPMSTADVISDTNAALASLDRDMMIGLGGDLDDANNGEDGCPLN
jgi:hypothetical protein